MEKEYFVREASEQKFCEGDGNISEAVRKEREVVSEREQNVTDYQYAAGKKAQRAEERGGRGSWETGEACCYLFFLDGKRYQQDNHELTFVGIM